MVALSLLVLLPTGPAAANHENDSHHWGKIYPPLVSAPCGQFGGQMCGWTGEAENFWVNNGFENRFRGGNPDYGCNAFIGWVTVCVVAGSNIPGASGRRSPTSPRIHMCTFRR